MNRQDEPADDAGVPEPDQVELRTEDRELGEEPDGYDAPPVETATAAPGERRSTRRAS